MLGGVLEKNQECNQPWKHTCDKLQAHRLLRRLILTLAALWQCVRLAAGSPVNEKPLLSKSCFSFEVGTG